jgi:cation diffusion facilitator family transporter
VAVAALIGFLGNEAVALLRIKVGKEIGSAALIADGYHARVDGWTSLAVFIGTIGTWFGYPIVDPIVGLVIAIAILRMVWESGAAMFTRLLDGVDPTVLAEVTHAVQHTPEVHEVTQVRVRWWDIGSMPNSTLRCVRSCRWHRGMPLRQKCGINCYTICRISPTR